MAFDRTVVERYVDLNGDMTFFKIVGTSIVADPGEIIEVAVIDAGVDISVDGNRNLIASVADPNGRSIVKMVDKNNDGDFKDSGEYRVIYQSTLFTQLRDIAFAAPCRDRPPTAVISTLPANGIVELNTPMFFLGSASTDPCLDPLVYSWTNEDVTPTPPVVCTTFNCQMTYTGLPAIHKMGLTVKDPAGATNKAVRTVKAGPPSVIGFWPSNGPANTAVFLFGKNFQMAPGTVPFFPVVKFNNGTLTAPITQTVASDLLFVLQPAGVVAGIPGTNNGRITVDTAIAGAITSTNYNEPVQPGIKINGIWPGEIKVANLVFVFGQNFSIVPGANKITLNGVVTPIVQALDSTLVVFLVPNAATSGKVCITVPGFAETCSGSSLVILP